MSTKRRRIAKDKYTRDLEKFIAEYIADTGDQAWTTSKVAEWAIRNNKWEQRPINAIRQLARELSRTARQVYITDEHGWPIRKYHAFRLGDHQPMLWAAMEAIQREQMNEGKTMRRNNLASGCIQVDRDMGYYNRHHNPGEPILFDPDFTKDIADAKLPPDYADVPPPEDEPTED